MSHTVMVTHYVESQVDFKVVGGFWDTYVLCGFPGILQSLDFLSHALEKPILKPTMQLASDVYTCS